MPAPAYHIRTLLLYLAIPALFCVWVLSMPVFPSQDGPLHLYYVNIFRQLLAHTPGTYSNAFYINRYLPPYSLYYYGLIALGRVLSLPLADKLLVCLFFLLFALGIRALCRVVAGPATLAPFLALPLLLNWPLVMGFVNYSLATAIACFALAVWCRMSGRPGLRPRVLFLALLTAVILTHPVPWIFVLGFAFFDLALRLLRSRLFRSTLATKPGAPGSAVSSPNLGSSAASCVNPIAHLRLDLTTALLGCLGYLYLRHFSSNLPHPAPTPPAHLAFLPNLLHHLRDLALIHGLTVFSGFHGEPLLLRLLLTLLLPAALLLALAHTLRPQPATQSGAPHLASEMWDRSATTSHPRGPRTWTTAHTWIAFALTFLLVLPFLPDDLNGSHYFALRLLSLLYLSAIVAAAPALTTSRLRVPLAIAAILTSLLSLHLATRFLSPAARTIATLDRVPTLPPGPGLLLRFQGQLAPPGLIYDPFFWAGAHVYRRQNHLLVNSAWLELAIIPVKPLPQTLPLLDTTFYDETPRFGAPLMRTPEEAHELLAKAASILALRSPNLPRSQSLFAPSPADTQRPSYAAGWICLNHPTWTLCTPPPPH